MWLKIASELSPRSLRQPNSRKVDQLWSRSRSRFGIKTGLSACGWSPPGILTITFRYMYLVHARKTYIEVLFGSDLLGGFSGDSWRWKSGTWHFFQQCDNKWYGGFLILVPNTCVHPYSHLTFTLCCWTRAPTGNARVGQSLHGTKG